MTDAKEIARLEKRHKDIRDLGVGALELQREREERQREMDVFALRNGLSCFKCGTTFNSWAKTGTSNGRHWAICVTCVRKK